MSAGPAPRRFAHSPTQSDGYGGLRSAAYPFRAVQSVSWLQPKPGSPEPPGSTCRKPPAVSLPPPAPPCPNPPAVSLQPPPFLRHRRLQLQLAELALIDRRWRSRHQIDGL